MTSDRPGSAAVEFPDDRTIVIIRRFDAPRQLVWDALTREELVRRTIAPFDEEVTACSIDLRVGGGYRFGFLAGDGSEMVFHGTFLEVEPPARTVQTWLFDGWPGVEAVESFDLREAGGGGTAFTYRLEFADAADRARMRGTAGLEANFDNLAELLASLQA